LTAVTASHGAQQKHRSGNFQGRFCFARVAGDRPVKQANFRQGQADFEGKEKYSEWRFVYVPRGPVVEPGQREHQED
jgi:hypothetical protein